MIVGTCITTLALDMTAYQRYSFVRGIIRAMTGNEQTTLRVRESQRFSLMPLPIATTENELQSLKRKLRKQWPILDERTIGGVVGVEPVVVDETRQYEYDEGEVLSRNI